MQINHYDQIEISLTEWLQSEKIHNLQGLENITNAFENYTWFKPMRELLVSNINEIMIDVKMQIYFLTDNDEYHRFFIKKDHIKYPLESTTPYNLESTSIPNSDWIWNDLNEIDKSKWLFYRKVLSLTSIYNPNDIVVLVNKTKKKQTTLDVYLKDDLTYI